MDDALELTTEVRARGESIARLYRGTRSGSLVRVRHGAYARQSDWAQLSEREKHLALVHALEQERPGQTFSHWSAAALLGLPIVGRWPLRPHVVVAAGNGISRRALTVTHGVELTASERTDHSGLSTTSVARTAIDVAALTGPVTGMVILDAAAARVGRGTLVDEIARRRPFRGVVRVDAAMRVVTGLAESPLESLSLLRFAQLGFPQPQQQRWFEVSGDRFRVDFYWQEVDAVGEADGWSKYGDDPDTIKKNLREEKRREDELRTRVRGFARWEWPDAWASAPLAARLQAAGVPRDRAKASAVG